MKKIYRIFVLAAAAAALFSCVKENDATDAPMDENVVPESYSFSAVFSDVAKASLYEGKKVKWNEGDAITVFDGNGAAGWTTGWVKGVKYSTKSGGATAYFDPAAPDDTVEEGKAVYYATYPAVDDLSCDMKNGIMHNWLTNRQMGVKDNVPVARQDGRNMNFAIAMTTDPQNEPLRFYNMLSLLKVVVPENLAGKIHRIGVHAKGEYIGGDVAMCYNNGNPWVKLRANLEGGAGSTYSDIYLLPDGAANSVDPNNSTFEAGTYYIAVLPCDLQDGFTVDYQSDADKFVGAIACEKSYGPITLERSKIYNLGSIAEPGDAAQKTGEGIDGLPYVFSFFDSEPKNETLKYITKGTLNERTFSYSNGNAYRLYTGIAATDKDNTGVTLELAACTYFKVGAADAKTSKLTFDNWAQVNGHDNLNTKCITSRYSVAGQPFDCGWYLNVPLKADLPANFTVSFGDCVANEWGLNTLSLMYSYDKRQWLSAGNFRIKEKTASGTRYYYYSADVQAPKVFRAGTILYLKLVTIGNFTVKSYETNKGYDGFGEDSSNSGQHRFHSCIAITATDNAATQRPSDAVYFEAFDGCKGGLDYLIGEKLAGMANHCGGEAQVSGYELSNVYQRPGYLQVGYVDTQTMAGQADMRTTNRSGSVTTPALGKAGDLALSFKACAYRNQVAGRTTSTDTNADVASPDATSIVVTVVGEGTIDGQKSIQIDGLSTSAWQTITKTIAGADAQTKIQFSSPSEGKFHRWFLDEIYVK